MTPTLAQLKDATTKSVVARTFAILYSRQSQGIQPVFRYQGSQVELGVDIQLHALPYLAENTNFGQQRMLCCEAIEHQLQYVWIQDCTKEPLSDINDNHCNSLLVESAQMSQLSLACALLVN